MNAEQYTYKSPAGKDIIGLRIPVIPSAIHDLQSWIADGSELPGGISNSSSDENYVAVSGYGNDAGTFVIALESEDWEMAARILTMAAKFLQDYTFSFKDAERKWAVLWRIKNGVFETGEMILRFPNNPDLLLETPFNQ